MFAQTESTTSEIHENAVKAQIEAETQKEAESKTAEGEQTE